VNPIAAIYFLIIVLRGLVWFVVAIARTLAAVVVALVCKAAGKPVPAWASEQLKSAGLVLGALLLTMGGVSLSVWLYTRIGLYAVPIMVALLLLAVWVGSRSDAKRLRRNMSVALALLLLVGMFPLFFRLCAAIGVGAIAVVVPAWGVLIWWLIRLNRPEAADTSPDPGTRAGLVDHGAKWDEGRKALLRAHGSGTAAGEIESSHPTDLGAQGPQQPAAESSGQTAPSPQGDGTETGTETQLDTTLRARLELLRSSEASASARRPQSDVRCPSCGSLTADTELCCTSCRCSVACWVGVPGGEPSGPRTVASVRHQSADGNMPPGALVSFAGRSWTPFKQALVLLDSHASWPAGQPHAGDSRPRSGEEGDR
jgi:hypothetical protein